MTENPNISLVTEPGTAPELAAALSGFTSEPQQQSPEAVRQAQAQADYLAGLVRSLHVALQSNPDIAHKLSALNERVSHLQLAAQSGDAAAIEQAAIDVDAYLSGNLGLFREAITHSDDHELEKKLKEMAAISKDMATYRIEAASAATVAYTSDFLSRHSAEFNPYSEPTKQYIAENTAVMMEQDPLMREARRIEEIVAADPAATQAIEERREEAKEATEDIDEEARLKRDKETRKYLAEIYDMLGEDRLPPDLIEIQQAYEDNPTPENYEKLKEEVARVHAETKAAVDNIYMRGFQYIPAGLKQQLADTLAERGLELNGENLRLLVEELKEQGKLEPENIDPIVAKLNKANGDLSVLSDDERLALAALQMNFNAESGKTMYNIAEHLLKMPPEKRKEFSQELQALYTGESGNRVESIVTLFQKYDFKLEGSREEGAMLAFHMKNMEFDDLRDIVRHKMHEIETGESRAQEIGAIYRQAIGAKMASVLDGKTLTDDQKDKIKLGMNLKLLQETYGLCMEDIIPSTICPLDQKTDSKLVAYDVADIIRDQMAWLDFADVDLNDVTSPEPVAGSQVTPSGKNIA